MEWGQPIPASVPPSPSPVPISEQLPEQLPDGPALLALERASRGAGTGLREADLVGQWRLDQVWGKGSTHPAAFNSALLRALVARLEITPGENAESLRLGNVVNLGALELRFDGAGQLRGRRPLLVFWFERVQVRLGARLLLDRPLRRPEPKRLPFFALIASSPGGEAGDQSGWLAARGRGGGLALWRLEP